MKNREYKRAWQKLKDKLTEDYIEPVSYTHLRAHET